MLVNFIAVTSIALVVIATKAHFAIVGISIVNMTMTPMNTCAISRFILLLGV